MNKVHNDVSVFLKRTLRGLIKQVLVKQNALNSIHFQGLECVFGTTGTMVAASVGVGVRKRLLMVFPNFGLPPTGIP